MCGRHYELATNMHLPSDALSFSMPAKRFFEMAEDIYGMFWNRILERIEIMNSMGSIRRIREASKNIILLPYFFSHPFYCVHVCLWFFKRRIFP
ncbi:MAG TPA: hypothetical protein DCP92_12265 [Nitrospiraceae bacterium]|nr:hypothetical protein [Nitrospiraceae bacterium]